MTKRAMKVTPWEVSGEVNYDKLVKEFGTFKISDEMRKKLGNLHPLIRRGLYFSHRDFDNYQ